MTDFAAKDWFLLFAGFGLSIIASGIWQWWSLSLRKGRQNARALEAQWDKRLNSAGYIIRAEAASEIMVRSIYWFVLGNMMFAISGFALVLNFSEPMRQSAVSSGVSVAAFLFLANSLRWLRLYLRLKRPVSPQSGASAPAEGTP